MTILTQEQILLIMERLKWEPVYEDTRIVVCKKQDIGYSDDRLIGGIQAALSIALEMERRRTAK